MQEEYNDVTARMQSDLIEYEVLNERNSQQEDVAEAASDLSNKIKGTITAVRKFESQLLEKVQLLVPKKEETKSLVDQSSESRKRKREEEEEPFEKVEMKQVAVKVNVPAEKMCFVAGKFYSNRERLENTRSESTSRRKAEKW